MLKRDVLGISLTKKEEDMDFYIYFKCDFKKDLVSYVIVRKNDEFRTENKGIVTNEEELYNLIYSYNLEDSAEKMVNFRLSKERKYRDVRKYLLNKIEKMDLNVHQRAILTSIILKTTELSEYAGTGNVVVINKGDGIVDEVKIADETKFGVMGPKLHLQLIQTVDGEDGAKHKNYPDLYLEELIKLILNSQYAKPKKSRKA